MNIGDLVKLKNVSFFLTRMHNEYVGVILEKRGENMLKVKWNVPEEKFQTMWHDKNSLKLIRE